MTWPDGEWETRQNLVAMEEGTRLATGIEVHLGAVAQLCNRQIWTVSPAIDNKFIANGRLDPNDIGMPELPFTFPEVQ